MTIKLKDGTKTSVPYNKYNFYHYLYFFTPPRCKLCGDFINRYADFVCMDAWLPEIVRTDKQGSSLVVVRTETGKTIIENRSKKVVHLSKIPSSEIIRSQGKHRLSNKDLEAYYFIAKMQSKAIPNYNIALPRSKISNYLRSLLVNANVWISEVRFPKPIIAFIAKIEYKMLRNHKAKK